MGGPRGPPGEVPPSQQDARRRETRSERVGSRTETRPTPSRDDGATLRSVGTGMKRLTRAEQGQTRSMKGLQETGVGR